MTANVITYRGRSAAREVGKVLGLENADIDRLARMMSQFEFVEPGETLARNLREADLNPDDPRYQLFARLWCEMQDLPRHLGQHSGGMVVCQGRLDEVVPLENASMPGRVVVQWDKDDCADLGIVKVDLLGLGMMAVLEEALDIVNGTGQGQGTRRLDSKRRSEVRRLSKFEVRSGPSAPRRSGGLRDAAAGRHGRRVPGGVASADGDAAAAQAQALLRSRRGSGDHPARADRRQDGASLSGDGGAATRR